MILNDNKSKDYQLHIYTASLMIMIASADDNLEDSELNIIEEIIFDFYAINQSLIDEIMNDANEIVKKSTDIYEIASYINRTLNKQDKIDLICCIFEVAYNDNNLHFMERHLINKISNIFNLNKQEILKARKEIERYLK